MLSTQDNMIEPVARRFSSQGLELHYLDWGNQNAPPLILVHGMWDHARSWDWVARALCKDWRIIVPDLRGHGDSGWSPDGAYLSPYYLMDFVDLVDSLGFEQCSIIAHSFGGNPAARFAALYPDRVLQLVLVDAMGPDKTVLAHWAQEGPLKRTREWIGKKRKNEKASRYFESVKEVAARLQKNNQSLTLDKALHIATHGVSLHSQGYSWKYDPDIGNFLPEEFAIDLSHYWQAITAPTLLCWGPKGWTTNPGTDGRAEFFRTVEIRIFEESGHWIHHDQTREFIAVLKDFLSLSPRSS